MRMAQKLEGGSRALQDVLDTLAKVNRINLVEVEQAAEAAKTVQQKFIEELEKGKPLNRAKPKRKKLHWKKRVKYLREYHQNVRRPRNAVAKGELLRKEGWYALLKQGWDKAGTPVEVSKEEWDEAVGALLDCVPVVGRYDTSIGIRLDNVVIRDRDTLKVVFDGKEWDMKRRGYIL
jgi:hypothetical protein